MCFNDYQYRGIPGGTEYKAGPKYIAQTVITIIFILEFTFKVIAQGFFFGENAYFDDA
jgi:hypothetical protein